jgi:citrate synthase
MAEDSLTITDNRTGKTYEVPIFHGTYPKYASAINTADLRGIKVDDDDFGLMGYDPSYLNTASCKSSITFIDGDKGILRYRGYPIEQLAENSSYLEVAYLLLHGELPKSDALAEWTDLIKDHEALNESIKQFVSGFRYDSHTMGMLVGSLGALSTFYPESRDMHNEALLEHHTARMIGKVATIGAFVYRHSRGLPYIYPNRDLGFCENFFNMLFAPREGKFETNPALVKALEVLFILHADHEQNCSASTMRGIGSGHADPYSSLAGASAALYGPLHGGANEAVLKMLAEIGDIKNVPGYIEKVKNREVLLQGFGHRVYKNYDPRATIIKKTAYEVFEVTGKNPLIDIALELERIALEDDFFVSRSLYPNVDFYSGIIYQAMGLPVDMYPVLFAIPRTAGWLAQWREMLADKEQKIARPRQVYTGEGERDFVPMSKR